MLFFRTLSETLHLLCANLMAVGQGEGFGAQRARKPLNLATHTAHVFKKAKLRLLLLLCGLIELAIIGIELFSSQ